MQDQIEVEFPISLVNSCITNSTDPVIYIKDQDNNKCIVVDNSVDYHFFIDNIDNNQVHILSIDKCIYNDQSPTKKCDFAFFTNRVFAFVEIKDTISRSGLHKRKAKLQLETTIINFQNQLDFSQLELYAIISWRYRPLRPAASTAMQDAKFEFLTNYNVNLVEGNKFVL